MLKSADDPTFDDPVVAYMRGYYDGQEVDPQPAEPSNNEERPLISKSDQRPLWFPIVLAVIVGVTVLGSVWMMRPQSITAEGGDAEIDATIGQDAAWHTHEPAEYPTATTTVTTEPVQPVTPQPQPEDVEPPATSVDEVPPTHATPADVDPTAQASPEPSDPVPVVTAETMDEQTQNARTTQPTEAPSEDPTDEPAEDETEQTPVSDLLCVVTNLVGLCET